MDDAWQTAYELGAERMIYPRADGTIMNRPLPPFANNITEDHKLAIHSALGGHFPPGLYARILAEYIKNNGL